MKSWEGRKLKMVLVQTSDPQTSDATKVGQYERRTNKRRTSTNVRLVQTSDWYKRQTGTNVGPVQTSDGYIYNEKRRTLVDFELTIFF